MSMQSDSSERDEAISPSDGALATSPLTADQINRWSALIVEGQHPIPHGLTPADLDALTAKVRQMSRQRLINLTVRAIAKHLCRDDRQRMEE